MILVQLRSEREVQMCKQRSIKNKVLCSCAIIIFMAAILYPIVGSKNVSAQWLYYPANAISLYGTPSITLPFPAPAIPTLSTTLPYNLYYPAIGAPPGIPVFPPLPLAPTTATAPIAATAISSIISSPTSIFSPITIISPLSLSALVSRFALTTINPVAATSIFSLLSSLPALTPVVAPTNVYNLYYPAVGSPPGIPILPPAATGIGTLPYNLFYPAGTAPGIPVLPPLP